jgi:hypothetical protein
MCLSGGPESQQIRRQQLPPPGPWQASPKASVPTAIGSCCCGECAGAGLSSEGTRSSLPLCADVVLRPRQSALMSRIILLCCKLSCRSFQPHCPFAFPSLADAPCHRMCMRKSNESAERFGGMRGMLCAASTSCRQTPTGHKNGRPWRQPGVSVVLLLHALSWHAKSSAKYEHMKRRGPASSRLQLYPKEQQQLSAGAGAVQASVRVLWAEDRVGAGIKRQHLWRTDCATRAVYGC